MCVTQVILFLQVSLLMRAALACVSVHFRVIRGGIRLPAGNH